MIKLNLALHVELRIEFTAQIKLLNPKQDSDHPSQHDRLNQFKTIYFIILS